MGDDISVDVGVRGYRCLGCKDAACERLFQCERSRIVGIGFTAVIEIEEDSRIREIRTLLILLVVRISIEIYHDLRIEGASRKSFHIYINDKGLIGIRRIDPVYLQTRKSHQLARGNVQIRNGVGVGHGNGRIVYIRRIERHARGGRMRGNGLRFDIELRKFRRNIDIFTGRFQIENSDIRGSRAEAYASVIFNVVRICTRKDQSLQIRCSRVGESIKCINRADITNLV